MSVAIYNSALSDAAHAIRRVADDAENLDERTVKLFIRALARIEDLKKTPRQRADRRPGIDATSIG